MKEQTNLRSLVFSLFPFDLLLKLYKLAHDFSCTNNVKRDEIISLLNEFDIPYVPVGPGTNRYTAVVKGYIVKFSLDTDGMIDNLREFKYSMDLQPYVLRVYEVLPDGLLMICEYVERMEDEGFKNPTIRSQVLKILAKLSSAYYIGDVGLDDKNYSNWGFRRNLTHDLVILDFAYCYSLSFKAFMCDCSPGAMLYYNERYTHLICPKCNKSYSFSDVRRKISRKDQEQEIGDVMKMGYVLHSASETHKVNPEFSWKARDEKEDKKEREFQSLKEDDLDYSIIDVEEDDTENEEEENDEEKMWDDIAENLPF